MLGTNSNITKILQKRYQNEKKRYKLDVKNIINIYDSCTAETKDGDIISLIKDNEEDKSIVQEIQKQTDKYLVASHLALKDGKLYDFSQINNAKEVVAGIPAKSSLTYAGNAKYNINNKTIELRNQSEYFTTGEGEIFIEFNGLFDQLPKFIDIAEYRDSHLTRLYYKNINDPESNYNVDYSEPDTTTKVYAIDENGQLWTYIEGHIIDTGINLDYFGPTLDYSIDDTSWTNKNIKLEYNPITKGKVIKSEIIKGEDIVKEIEKEEEGIEHQEFEIEKNGNYSIKLTDSKLRVYTTYLNISNIDKLPPKIQSTGIIENNQISIEAEDQIDETKQNGKSGIKSIEIANEEPREGTEWTNIDGQQDDEGNLIAKLGNVTEGQKIYARTTDKAGNTSDIIKIEIAKKEEPDPTPDPTPDSTPDSTSHEDTNVGKKEEINEIENLANKILPKTGKERTFTIEILTIIVTIYIIVLSIKVKNKKS